MDVVYEPVADHQDLTTSSLCQRCIHQVHDKTIPCFYVYTPQPLYDTIAGIQANFHVSYPIHAIMRVECTDMMM